MDNVCSANRISTKTNGEIHSIYISRKKKTTKKTKTTQKTTTFKHHQGCNVSSKKGRSAVCSVLRLGDSPAGFSASDCRMSELQTPNTAVSLPPLLTVDCNSGREMLRIGGGEVGGAVLMLRPTPGIAACFLFKLLMQFVGAICWAVRGMSSQTPPPNPTVCKPNRRFEFHHKRIKSRRRTPASNWTCRIQECNPQRSALWVNTIQTNARASRNDKRENWLAPRR